MDEPKRTSWLAKLKTMGLAAFLFFLIKGLIWLAVFFGLGKWIKNLFA